MRARLANTESFVCIYIYIYVYIHRCVHIYTSIYLSMYRPELEPTLSFCRAAFRRSRLLFVEASWLSRYLASGSGGARYARMSEKGTSEEAQLSSLLAVASTVLVLPASSEGMQSCRPKEMRSPTHSLGQLRSLLPQLKSHTALLVLEIKRLWIPRAVRFLSIEAL